MRSMVEGAGQLCSDGRAVPRSKIAAGPLSRLRGQLPACGGASAAAGSSPAQRGRGTAAGGGGGAGSLALGAHVRAPVATFKHARTLRREMSLPEVVLWQVLRGGRPDGLRFRRQHPIGPYVLDFYCPSIRLAVEVDGAAHNHPERVDHDARRDAWLAERGVAILRFSAKDVLKDETLEDALRMIAETAALRSVARGA